LTYAHNRPKAVYNDTQKLDFTSRPPNGNVLNSQLQDLSFETETHEKLFTFFQLTQLEIGFTVLTMDHTDQCTVHKKN